MHGLYINTYSNNKVSWCSNNYVTVGMVTLSPMMVASVCHVGDPLNLTCTASVEFISWSFTVVNEQGRDEEITIFSTSRAPSNQSMPIVVNSTTFTLIRNSAQIVLPLISTSSIDSVSIGLNGTVVNCSDPGNSTTSASTTIKIIDTSNSEWANHHNYLDYFASFKHTLVIDNYTLTLRNISEYSADNITVTVEWTQQVYTTYDVTVVPLVPIVFTGNTSCQLTVPYNMEYNLTVKATVPCRSNATAFIRLNYSKISMWLFIIRPHQNWGMKWDR